MKPTLFIGAAAGRCGTMMLANLLNSEAETLCLHEGQVRHGELKGEKVLPFLTLQNGAAYQQPETAAEMLAEFRGGMGAAADHLGVALFGDIAYNYAPFLRHIPSVLPEAKVIYIHRSGVDFVQTASALSGDDPAPLGWPPNGKPLSALEQFVAMGRLRPRTDDPLTPKWDDDFDHFERNAWLWSETNALILDGLCAIPPAQYLTLRFDELFGNLQTSYAKIRVFLGFQTEMRAETRALIDAGAINRRSRTEQLTPDQWTEEMRANFTRLAGPMMARLGYPFT